MNTDPMLPTAPTGLEPMLAAAQAANETVAAWRRPVLVERCRNLPASDYHSQARTPGVSSTFLRAFATSPADGIAALMSRTASREMAVGSIVHDAALRGLSLAEATAPFVVFQHDGRTREGRAERGAARATGRTAIDEADLRAVQFALASLRLHPVASRLLFTDESAGIRGQSETVIRWPDPTTGLACKAQIDRIQIVDGRAVLVDLKTTSKGVSVEDAARTFRSMRYDLQLAHYTAGWEAYSGERLQCRAVFVETAPPYSTAVHVIDDEVIDRAERRRRVLLAQLSDCIATGCWPGPADGVIELTKWQRMEE